MNTFVMFKKSSEDNVDNTDNITIITSSKTLEDFKSLFDKKVAAFVNQVKEINVLVTESNNKLTQEDYDSEEMTENMEVFSKHYNNLEEFKKQNFVFEFEGQYLDMKKWFWNNEYLYEYEIYNLEDWVKIKLAETKQVPEYSCY